MNRQWSPWKQETRLLDPHVALKMDEGSKICNEIFEFFFALGGDGVALVTGSYYYYHYMQDRFNDKVGLMKCRTTLSLPLSLSGLGVCLQVTADPLVLVPLSRLHGRPRSLS